MKNKKLIVLTSTLLLSLCGCQEGKVSDNVHSIERAYFLDMKTGNAFQGRIDLFSKNPYVVYVPIEDYQTYVPSYSMKVTRDNNVFTFTSLANNSKAYLNGDSGELSYDSYSFFHSYSGTPHQEIFSTAFPYQEVEGESNYQKGNRYSINLSNYNLQPIKDGNYYYLPLDILMRIDPLGSKGTAYYNGKTGKDGLVTLLFNENDDLKKYLESYEVIKEYPASFYEFAYDVLTFDIDLCYGLNGFSRPMRHNNQHFTYNPNGARKTLESYKNSVVNATTIEAFDTAVDKILSEQLDDGGHTYGLNNSLATDKGKLDPSYGKAPEIELLNDVYKQEKEARQKASEEEHLSSYLYSFDTDKDGYGDIGYFTIPKFINRGSQSMIDLLTYANQMFNKNNTNKEYYVEDAKHIKDVVIDLAYNSGGDTSCEGLLLSWLCEGKAKQVLQDARDKSITTSVFKYDINRDGKFDEGDYLPNDVNLYILTDATYSAGCAAVFDTYMYTLSDAYKSSGRNIKFIGKPNLGGACSITGSYLLPTCFTYQMSSCATSINWYDKTKTCDEIMPISEGWELTTEQIVSRTGYINPKIVSARQK